MRTIAPCIMDPPLWYGYPRGSEFEPVARGTRMRWTWDLETTADSAYGTADHPDGPTPGADHLDQPEACTGSAGWFCHSCLSCVRPLGREFRHGSSETRISVSTTTLHVLDSCRPLSYLRYAQAMQKRMYTSIRMGDGLGRAPINHLGDVHCTAADYLVVDHPEQRMISASSHPLAARAYRSLFTISIRKLSIDRIVAFYTSSEDLDLIQVDRKIMK